MHTPQRQACGVRPSTPLLPAPPSQVLTFAGELLHAAQLLLRDGLHPTEIADGYARAGTKALEVLDSLVLPGSEKLDVRSMEEVSLWGGARVHTIALRGGKRSSEWSAWGAHG